VIEELREEGRDFILVTHEMGFARQVPIRWRCWPMAGLQRWARSSRYSNTHTARRAGFPGEGAEVLTNRARRLLPNTFHSSSNSRSFTSVRCRRDRSRWGDAEHRADVIEVLRRSSHLVEFQLLDDHVLRTGHAGVEGFRKRTPPAAPELLSTERRLLQQHAVNLHARFLVQQIELALTADLLKDDFYQGTVESV